MSSDPVLSYRNESSLDSDDGRPLPILAEYLQPPQASHPVLGKETLRGDELPMLIAEPAPQITAGG